MKKYLFMLPAILYLAGCQSLEDTYKDMAGDGPIRYLGKCNDLKVKAGWERLKLTWNNNIDPVISNVRVTWASDDVKGEVILPRGTTGYDIVDLADGNYEIRLCSLDEKGNSSLSVVTYGRPYTMDHELVRSFSRVVSKHIFVRDRLILIFESLPDNIRNVRLAYTTADGEAKILPLDAETIKSGYMLLEDRIDPARPVTVERTGLIVENKKEPDIAVEITLAAYELTHARIMAVDFKMAIEGKYGKMYDDDAFVENLTELELDYSLNSFEDILYFSNLSKLHLGKNRFQWDDGMGYRIIELYGNASKVYESKKSAFMLDVANEIIGLTVDRYNRHYLPSPFEGDYLNEKGNPTAPERTFLDTGGWKITNEIKDVGSYDSHLEYLFDGNPDTAWQTELTVTRNTHHIEVDMAEVKAINGARISQRRFNPDRKTGTPLYLTLMPELITIQYSTDRIQWHNTGYVDGNVLGNTVGEVTEIEFPEPRNARYLKIILSELPASSNYSITLAEIAVF